MNDNVTQEELNWMKKALASAQKALEAGEFPVGCILVSQGRIVGQADRIHSKGDLQNELDHAEILALRDWINRGRPGGTFTAYTTLEPCLMCLGALILNGAKAIVYSYEDIMGGATAIDFDRPFSRASHTEPARMLEHLYRDFAKRIKGPVLREESLELFKRFFSMPGNTYLKDTLLEAYTLAQ